MSQPANDGGHNVSWYGAWREQDWQEEWRTAQVYKLCSEPEAHEFRFCMHVFNPWSLKTLIHGVNMTEHGIHNTITTDLITHLFSCPTTPNADDKSKMLNSKWFLLFFHFFKMKSVPYPREWLQRCWSDLWFWIHVIIQGSLNDEEEEKTDDGTISDWRVIERWCFLPKNALRGGKCSEFSCSWNPSATLRQLLAGVCVGNQVCFHLSAGPVPFHCAEEYFVRFPRWTRRTWRAHVWKKQNKNKDERPYCCESPVPLNRFALFDVECVKCFWFCSMTLSDVQ